MKNFTAFTIKNANRLRVLKSRITISVDKKINPESHDKAYTAIWDTGASGTVISNRVAEEMNLIPTGKTIVSTANGQAEVNKYIITLKLPNRLIINDIEVVSGNLGEGTDMLIGMDIITLGDFSITNVDGNTTMSFRFPSCESIDYVAEANELKRRDLRKQKNIIEKKIKQDGNKLCACGSGKKYRYCCGKENIKQAKEELEKMGV